MAFAGICDERELEIGAQRNCEDILDRMNPNAW